MYNFEKKDELKNLQDEWCEYWAEEWHETWYDEAPFNKNQVAEDSSKIGQTAEKEFLKTEHLDDVPNYHTSEESEYKEEIVSNNDHQVKYKPNFLDYVDELESALDPQIPINDSNKVHYDSPNASIDSVISMD